MATELFSEGRVTTFGYNTRLLWARIDPGNPAVLLDAFGIKSISRENTGLYTVTFMEAYPNGGSFNWAVEETDGGWGYVKLVAWGASNISAQIQYARNATLATGLAVSDGATGSVIHLWFMMRGR